MNDPRDRTNRAPSNSLAEGWPHADNAARLSQVAFGREVRLLELEQEVNALCERHGEAARYARPREQATPAGDAALQLREARYRTFFESIDEGFCIIEKVGGDAGEPFDFTYVEANPAFAVQSGVSNVVGKTIREAFPGESEEWLTTYDTVLRTGEPIGFEYRLTTLSRVVDVYAFRVGNGPSHRVAIRLNNITDRRLAEEAVRESEAFNRSIIESSPDCIKVLDLDGNLLSMPSGQALLGIEDIEPFLNKSWIDFWDGEHRTAAKASVELAVEGGTGNFVGFFRTLRDEPKWWDVCVSPILDAHGKPARLLVVSRDVTQRKQFEDDLRQRGVQFETLLNEAPLGVFLIDADFRIRQVNPSALLAFSDIPDVVGRDFDEVMHIVWPEEQASAVVTQFRHTLATGERFVAPELIGERADRNTTEYYEWQINRIPLPDGRHGVVAYFRDISERVSAQLQIRDSEERYRTLFSSIDEGFCLIEVIFDDHDNPVDWRFLEVNPSFEKQTGIANIVGKRMRELAPDHEQYWFDTYGKVVLTGEPVRFVNEAKALDSRWFDLYAFPVGGRVDCKVAVIFTNITERVRAEEALRQSEERFRALFDSGPIAMYSCDSSGAIQHYNRGAAELWGREPKPGDTDEDFRGLFSFYHPDGRLMPFLETPMTSVLRGTLSAARNVEMVIERPVGDRITVIANVVPFRNGRGEITGAINCFYDITERSRLERKTQDQAEALAELHRRKDEFLAMLSHELRNPLAPISHAAQLLSLQKNQDPLQAKACSIIQRQVGQLKHLVDDLLDVSRITTGGIQLRRERIAVDGIVERSVETAHPLIVAGRHELTVSVPAQPIWLHADAARLEQVIVNLLTNAAKYTMDGGHIWLTVEPEGAFAVLRVRDTGIGIAPDLLPRIFDLFAQAERSLARSQGGLGIGLSLVQRLVELHGGTVEAHSVLGHGSEFVVRLPLTPIPVPARALPHDASVHPLNAGLAVLVVDDNADAAQSLAILLTASGHDVRLAFDGPSALEAILHDRPDVVLLDIGLPGLDGFEVATQIRQQDTNTSIMLVALTGYGQERDRQRAFEVGFDHHLVKPADYGEVENILATVAERTT